MLEKKKKNAANRNFLLFLQNVYKSSLKSVMVGWLYWSLKPL